MVDFIFHLTIKGNVQRFSMSHPSPYTPSLPSLVLSERALGLVSIVILALFQRRLHLHGQPLAEAGKRGVFDGRVT